VSDVGDVGARKVLPSRDVVVPFCAITLAI
jgi:hypothetical protein